MVDLPRIISVDDHVVEPPDLWSSRLPARYQDTGPRVVRDRAKFSFQGGVFSYEKGVADGDWCDWWIYDQLVYPFPKLSAVALWLYVGGAGSCAGGASPSNTSR